MARKSSGDGLIGLGLLVAIIYPFVWLYDKIGAVGFWSLIISIPVVYVAWTWYRVERDKKNGIAQVKPEKTSQQLIKTRIREYDENVDYSAGLIRQSTPQIAETSATEMDRFLRELGDKKFIELPFKDSWVYRLNNNVGDVAEYCIQQKFIEPASLDESANFILKKPDLQALLRSNDLPTGGTKSDLIERAQTHCKDAFIEMLGGEVIFKPTQTLKSYLEVRWREIARIERAQRNIALRYKYYYDVMDFRRCGYSGVSIQKGVDNCECLNDFVGEHPINNVPSEFPPKNCNAPWGCTCIWQPID